MRNDRFCCFGHYAPKDIRCFDMCPFKEDCEFEKDYKYMIKKAKEGKEDGGKNKQG